MATLILLLSASRRALEYPSLMVLRMSSRRLRIFLHRSTISGMRQRDAQPIHHFEFWIGYNVLDSPMRDE